ncbi:glycerophosphodiester phosphodiesterase [Levilactobacillus zymae]|uniref:glycerophosphodiester phosphodiesterase n=1 Tax=Levilactobacillus zymae TaxID=267363 RepID=UPI001E56A87D|nr:glycerophosphodiester phosphodiesterase [Levilactobacillus zymae]
MRTKRQELYRAWRWGLTAPRLLAGWTGLIAGLGLLRWAGQLAGWSLGWLLVIGAELGLAVWQLRQLARVYGAQLALKTGWRRWGTGLGLGVSLGLLSLPWGLWGLGSRLLVRLRLPAAWVNWVGLHRHGLAGIVVVAYLVLLAYSLIWGPRHWRVTRQGGTPRQMLGSLLVLAGGMALWFLGSCLLVVLNRQLATTLTGTVITWLTAGSLGLILGGYTLVSLLGTLTVVWSWCGQPALPVAPRWPRTSGWGLVLVLVWLVVSGGVITQTLQQPRLQATVLISHRGVDRGVGVQNTLGALRHVSRQHPRYVEMDLHETRDHQWVVLHDENLRELAGVNVTPHQWTLRQLTRLTLHEHGQRARLVGWDQYLRTAERLPQPLLVELKTTPADSAGMVRRFAQRYGTRLHRDHSAVHSLDYRVVAGLRRDSPQLRVGYITPFNFVAPASVPADFYSFQRLSVSDQFIQAAHRAHAPAYLWTPNTRLAMTQAWALGADGQITNQVSRLRHVVTQRPSAAMWAVLWNFTLSYI